MPVVGAPYQGDNQNVVGEGIGSLLNLVLTMNKNRIDTNKDRAYRSAAAKTLGVPEEELGYFQREDLKDLVKEKYKASYSPKEWKPTNKEEALEIARAKKDSGVTKKNIVRFPGTGAPMPDENVPTDSVKDFENNIKINLANGIPLNENQTKYYNRLMKRASDEEMEYIPPVDPNAKPAENKIISFFKSLANIGNEIKPNLDPLTNILNKVPEKSTEVVQPISPVVEDINKENKSPYTEYPDAFQENGVWKVIKDGKKYRIQE